MIRAKEEAERTLNCHQKNELYFLVTKETHPALFGVFEAISHDNGMGAGHDNYSVPVGMEDDVRRSEAVLLTMTEHGRELIAIGDQDAARTALDCVKDGDVLDRLLVRFFNDWTEEGE